MDKQILDVTHLWEEYKRLEQENECLKEKLIIAQNSDNKTMEILKENAELKKENAELKKENKENLHYLACMTEQRNKLKLILEEIRMISDNYNLTVNKRREQIANKINEVLGND